MLKWDLTQIYKNKKELKKEIASLEKAVCSFSQYQQSLKSLSDDNLEKAVIKYMKIRDRIYKLSVYSFFIFSENPKQSLFYSTIQEYKKDFLRKISFFEYELAHLPETKITRLLGNKDFFWIKGLILNQKHLTNNPLFFEIREKIAILYSKTKGACDKTSKQYCEILRESIELNKKLAKIKKYSSRLSYQNGYNLIPDRFVSYTIAEISKSFKDIIPLFWNKVDDAHPLKIDWKNWQIRMPNMLFDEILENVINAISSFDIGYQKILRKMILKQHIHTGKFQNSYACQVCSKIDPYIFLSYDGTITSIPKTAHEFGHYLQQYVHRPKGPLYYDPPPVISEIFSVFFELLVLDFLIDKNDALSPLFSLLKAERLFSLIYLQSTLFLFEREIYKYPALKEEDLSRIWTKCNTFCFGNMLDKEKVSQQWQLFPYIISNPFYEFSYILSTFIALNLIEKYKSDKSFPIKFNILMQNVEFNKTYDLLKELFAIDIYQKNFITDSLKNMLLFFKKKDIM